MSQLESFRVLLVDDEVRLLESMEAVLAEPFASVAHLKRSNAAFNAVMSGDRK